MCGVVEAVSADGQRFVVVEALESEQTKPLSIHVVMNWFEEFRAGARGATR